MKTNDIKAELVGDVLKIQIAGVIGGDGEGGGVTAEAVLKEIAAAKGAKSAEVEISSGGGSYMHGLAMYHALKELAKSMPVTTKVIGIAGSAATLPLCAGNASCPKDGWVLIHEPSLRAEGDAAQLAQSAEDVEKIAAQMAGIYAEKTGMPVDKVRELMKSETYLTGEQAAAIKLVDEVTAQLDIAALATVDVAAHAKAPDALKAAIAAAKEAGKKTTESKTEAKAEAKPEVKAEADPNMLACMNACLAAAKMCAEAAQAAVPLCASSWEGAMWAGEAMNALTYAARAALGLADQCEDEVGELLPAESATAATEATAQITAVIAKLPKDAREIKGVADMVTAFQAKLDAKLDAVKPLTPADGKPADPRAEFKALVKAFGPEKAGKYFDSGKTLAEATGCELEALRAENGKLRGRETELLTQVESLTRRPGIPFEPAKDTVNGKLRVSESEFEAYCKANRVTGKAKETLRAEMCKPVAKVTQQSEQDGE